MRASSSSIAALFTLLMAGVAMAEVAIPDVGTPVRVHCDSVPSGRNYVTLDCRPGGGQADNESSVVSWMPKSARFEILPDAKGNVNLTLGITLRWDTLPQSATGGAPEDIRRYFHIGYSTDGEHFTWSKGISAYYSSGFQGELSDTPLGKWVRIEHQYSFTVPMSDNGKLLHWYLRDERTLNVANYQKGPLNPFTVSVDDVSIYANGRMVMMSIGQFDFPQADLTRNWQFWDGRTSSQQRLVPLR